MAYQPKNYKKFVATAATATLVATAIAPAAFADQASTSAFTDVGDRYTEAVDYVLSEGIAIGVSPTQFGVGASITRGDAAIMIAKATGIMNEEAPASGFSDVPKRGAVAVNSLKAAGVLSGVSTTKFGWDQPITRGQAAFMLAEAYNLEGGNASELKFTDVGESHRFSNAIAALVENKVTNGVTPTSFGIEASIKRGDFAIFLHRLAPAEVTPAPTPAPVKVDAVIAIDATTIEVTFDNGDVVEVEVATLVHGDNEVTFEVEGVEYSVTVNFVDEKVVAIQAAIAAAEAAIADLPDTITLADKQDVQDADTLVTLALDLDADAEIEGLDFLEAAFETIAQLEADADAIAKLAAAIEAAEVAIANLPLVADFTIEDIDALDAAYDLTYIVTDLGGNVEDLAGYELLSELDDRYELLVAIQEAQGAVEALTLATSSLANLDTQEKIDAATALVTPAQEAIEALKVLDADNQAIVSLTNSVEASVAMIANAEAVLAADVAVTAAEASLLDVDFAAARTLVDALATSNQRTLLNARLIELNEARGEILATVNTAINDVELYAALNVAPFTGVVTANVEEYNVVLDGSQESILEVQEAINQVNAEILAEELSDVIDAANLAVTDVEEADFAGDQETFEGLVAAAQEAIDALPADFIVEGSETPLAEELQTRLDVQVQLNAEYVNLVTPIENATTEISFNNALTAAGIDNVNTRFISEYRTAVQGQGFTTLVEVQNAIYVTNATNAVEALTVEGALAADQAEIDAAQVLVDALVEAEVLTEDNTLQISINEAQALLDAANEAAQELAEAIEAAEVAQAEFEAAGGDVEAEAYTAVTVAITGEDTPVILSTTETLATATAELVALAEAIEAAEAAQTEFVTAGGSVDATVYTDVTTAITSEETAVILSTTETLAAATADLVALTAAVAAAEQAQADFLAAGGLETNQLFIDLQAALDADPQVTVTIETETAELAAVTADLIATAAINAATTATELQPLLVELQVVSYNNLTSAQRLEVADLFLATVGEFTNTADIAIALDTAVTALDVPETEVNEAGYLALLASVNTEISEGTITTVDAAIEALNTEEYAALTSAQQLNAAENVIANAPTGGYTTIAQIVANF